MNEEQDPKEKGREQNFFDRIKPKLQALWQKLPSFEAIMNQLGPWLRNIAAKFNKEGLQRLGAQLSTSAQKLWQRLKNFSWSKAELQDQVKKLKAKSEELAQSETLKKQREKLSAKAKELGEKAQTLKDSASPLLNQAKEKVANTSSQLTHKQSKSEQKSQRKAPIWESRSGLPDQLEIFLLKLARLPWLGRFMEWWANLKLWQSDTLFFRSLFPLLALVSLILSFAGIFIFGYTRSELKQTEDELRVEASASLTQDIRQKYATNIVERANELEQIVLDNTTKAEIIADAPTFQDLNIQKMEEFSRSLLRKDSNLLNVLVLAKDEVKQAIRTRRIGDTTRFLFTCCELPPERRVHYDEINEPRWLAELSKESAGISEIYFNPSNGEKYFYHGSNIEDFKGAQTGGLLLRYNLNFAIRTLQKGYQTGLNFLLANDSLIVASSEDTLMPPIPVIGGDSLSKPIDYIITVINLIRQSSSQEEALNILRKGLFIRNSRAFQEQFEAILPGEVRQLNAVDSTGAAYLLSEDQAEAILNLSFGQLLGLKNRQLASNDSLAQLSVEEGRVLAMAYLDSMKSVGTGVIVDEAYLLTFATNRFGWLMVNQSTNEQYMAPILAKNEFITARFGRINSRIFWFTLLSGLFFLCLFLLLITGVLYRFVKPINQLVEAVAETRKASGKPIELEPDLDEIKYLGQSFAELSSDLKSYIHKLELSNQELEQYAHVIAHDLREPLRMVSSYVGLLARKHEEDFDEVSQEFVHFAVDGTKRMDQMIRDVLDYATLAKKLEEAESSKINLKYPVEHAIEMLKNKIEESQTEVTLKELPEVMCKDSYISIVFQNLIENAIKYRQENLPLKVRISAEKIDQKWLISVDDNGRGFPEEAQGKIFEMFTRWNEPKNGESSGIGLATCRKIMEHNNGEIWAESEGEGKGASFKLSFPAAPND
ncbi:MAG: ATP-binding protein [Bacteroidota bacterium]